MFCRKRNNKNYCVEISPRMNSLDIVKFILKKLKNNHNNIGIKNLYHYSSIRYKEKKGLYINFKRLFNSPYYNILLNFDKYHIYNKSINHNKQDTKWSCYIKVTKNEKSKNFKIKLSRQYDYQLDKPLYDTYSNQYLYLYWRIDNIIPINIEQFSGNRNDNTNIMNNHLQKCGSNPLTGYFRDGYCKTDQSDRGTHTVCSKMTDEFLNFTKSKGNDLSTPQNDFPGLKSGDNWCLCALRWKEALKEGKAPPVIVDSTHKKSLEYVNLSNLKKYGRK